MSSTQTPASPLDYQSPFNKPRPRAGVGTWLFRIGIGFVGLIGLASVILPSLCKSREPAYKAKCASNLHQIGLAISLYANENHGQYPDSFAALLKNEQITASVFTCPSSNDEAAGGNDQAEILTDFAKPHHQSYIYLGRGLTIDTATADTILAYEPPESHSAEGGNILYGDGHADWLHAKDAKLLIDKAIAATQPTVTKLQSPVPGK